MRILMVYRYFYPSTTGVGNHILSLSNKLIKNGHEIKVLTLNKDLDGNKLPKKGKLGEIDIERVANLINLMIKIRKTNYDIIHFHNYGDPYTAFGLLITTRINKPVIFTPHIILPPKNLFMKLLKKIYGLFYKFLILKSVDAIISLTEKDKNDLIQIGADPSKFKIIPNSVNIKDYNYVDSNLFRNKFHLETDYLLYVGRIAEHKGLTYLVKAMAKIRNKKLKLAIAGKDYGFKQKLLDLIKKLDLENNIIFTGYINNEELKSAYCGCKFFVLPSFYEGLSTVVLEAMVYGKPVIVANSGWAKYLIKHNVNGFLVEYGQPNEIYDIVKAASKIDLEKIRDNAIKTVQKYDWEKNVKKIERIYFNLLK